MPDWFVRFGYYNIETIRYKEIKKSINFYYWKSCKRLSRWSLIFFSRSSLCWPKICFSAHILCIIPISQNSHDVTKSMSPNACLHKLQRSWPSSRLDNGFSHASRHRIIIDIINQTSGYRRTLWYSHLGILIYNIVIAN